MTGIMCISCTCTYTISYCSIVSIIIVFSMFFIMYGARCSETRRRRELRESDYKTMVCMETITPASATTTTTTTTTTTITNHHHNNNHNDNNNNDDNNNNNAALAIRRCGDSMIRRLGGLGDQVI